MSHSNSQEYHDKEKGAIILDTECCAAEDAPDQAIAKRFDLFAPLLSKLFKSGVEARGVERVQEHQRDNKNFWNRSVIFPLGRLRAVNLSSLVYLCGGRTTMSILFRSSTVA